MRSAATPSAGAFVPAPDVEAPRPLERCQPITPPPDQSPLLRALPPRQVHGR
jgi:hypothetical protein